MGVAAKIISGLTTENGINYLNIGLMILSMAAAFILPFEVFLFSYAILGPLHYLTEISWLEKKNYFMKSKKDIWIFVILVILISIGVFDAEAKVNLYLGSFLFCAFVYGIIVLFVERLPIKLFLVSAAFVVSIMFNMNTYPDKAFLFFVVLLPTVVHVFIFTGAFIFYGALKTRSVSGLLSLLVFVSCAVILLFYVPRGIVTHVSEYARDAYFNFKILNTTLYNMFGYGEMELNDPTLFTNLKAIGIMRFIAFAYTYHYLNWFSKTTVIKWNQIPKVRMAVIVILWLFSVTIYAVNYRLGFYALFLLSLLHVFFEFPLNYTTFMGIGKELKSLLKF